MKRLSNGLRRQQRCRKSGRAWFQWIISIILFCYAGYHRALGALQHSSSFLQPLQQRRQSLLQHQHQQLPTITNYPDLYQSSIKSLRKQPTQLGMSLIPLPVDVLQRVLVTGVPTGAQYSTYWGRTRREQYARGLESAIITFLGVFMAYFMSFVVGGMIATIMGTLFAGWSVLNPEFQAYQRNWELRGGRDLVDPWMMPPSDSSDRWEDQQGLYGALFVGYIEDVCVVEEATSEVEFDLKDFTNYRMETDELEAWTGHPYFLRVRASDREAGRTLQVHCRMSEEYLDLRRNQPAVGVLLSTTPSFTTLSAMTDILVPDAECWIGDYPYLDRAEMESLLAEDEDIWDQLQLQRWDPQEVGINQNMVPTRVRNRNIRREEDY